MSDKVQRYYKYRGQVTSLCYHNEKLLFVTKHDEGQSTAIYTLDPDSGLFEGYNLPCSATDATLHSDSLLVTGSDGYIHHLDIKNLKFKTLETQIEPNASCIVYLNKKEFAVLCENKIYILSIKKASILSQIDLEQKSSHLVSSPDGNWLAVGNTAGEVTIFTREDSDQFVFSDSKKIHQGAITALAFDCDELRVLSSGNDYKLFMTHVRGELEPEDKSDSSAKAALNNIVLRDNKCYGTDTHGNIKIWEKGKKRFSTIKSAKSTALAFANWKDKPHLVVAKENNDIAFLPLEDKKHIGNTVLAISDAYNWAENEINKEPRQCESVLKELALFNDKKAIDLIHKVVISNTDVGICVAATELLASTKHPLAFRFLEQLLKSQSEKVRIAAFVGLSSSSQKILPVVQLALNAGFENIGILAIDALKIAAKKNEEAMEFLIATLNYKSEIVRQRVLNSLGEIYGEKSSEAEIIAFRSNKDDIRRLALIRLLKKNQLANLNVQSILRSSLEDKSDVVRFTGFVICLLQDTALVEVLRSKSADLHRQIYEIENWGKESKSKKIPTAKKTTKKLTENNLQALFQAMACNHIETSLKGAYYLALLKDTRALGALLQLSLASSENIRVQVCAAFRELKDPHATQRLNMMLQDKDMQVRDAAFSALEKIYEKNPLVVVESGFATADPEIVHDRSLHLLVTYLKKTKKKSEKEQCLSLLQQALNNTTISNEAFKVILALDFLTMKERLQLILKSIDSAIRKKVLIELKPQLKNDWAWNLLLEMQQDPHAEIRYQAFEMAKKQKRDIVQVLEKASICPYADIRELATTDLAHKITKDTGRLLLKMISDNEKNIRQLAIKAFITNGAEEELLVALDSKHPDVRNHAAQALAWFGNNKALAQLQQLLQQPKPKRDPEKEWQQQIIIAINGVANLFSSSSLDLVIPFLDNDDKAISEACAKALFWLTNQNDYSLLQEKLSHKNQNIQREIAFALAYYQDRGGLTIVQKFTEDSNYLIATFTLRQKNEEMFLSQMINQSTHAIQNLALRTLLLYMTKYRNPDLLISLLSSIYPHVRLKAISAFEQLANENKFQQFVWDFINKRQDGKTWMVDETKLQTIANVLASNDPHLTVWAIKHLLTRLEDKKRTTFDQNWSLFEKRFTKRIEKLKAETFDYNLAPQQAKQIIFGAYVGLSRIRRDQTKFAHYRQIALSKLRDIAQKDKTLQLSVQSVMFLTLNDCSALVREQAFTGLQDLGVATEDLTTQVFVTGHTDICKLALDLLINKQKKSDVSKMLSDIQKSFDNGLEVEVSSLLVDKQGGVKTWEAALTAKSPSLRKMAIHKLTELYDEDKKSHKVLHSALESPYKEIREQVAFALARKKDARAFEPLSKLLFSNDNYTQKITINALRVLQHPESTALFVKRIEDDPAETALTKEMLNAVGHFRNPKDIEVLNAFMEDKKTFVSASYAWLTISGFDQKIQDIEHDGDWLEKQHPRYLDVFQKLLDKWYHLGKYKSIIAQKDSLYWIKNNSIDSTLEDWCTISDERVRHMILTIVGWRLRKRNGTSAMLQKCLQSQEIIDRFLAAEALALHGNSTGLNILRTCLETLPQLDYRRRAVKAIGVLANDNAFDTLYDITSNNEHALYEEAIEALGHLRKSKKAKIIFEKLQKTLLSSTYNVPLLCKALHGLRWFDDHNSWNLIRSYTSHHNWNARLKVAELLQFNNDEANIDALQNIIRKDNDYDVLNQAHISLRKITNPQSLIVEEALLQCSQNLLENSQIEKFSQQASLKKLFDVLPKIQNQNIASALVSKVLEREDLVVKDALDAIKTSNDYKVVSLATQIVARAKLTKIQHKIVIDTLTKLWKDFSVDLENQQTTNAKILHKEEKLLACSHLVWVCGRIQVAKETICSILETKNQLLFHLHCVCVCALENFSSDKIISQTLTNTAKDNTSFIRNFASFTLTTHKEADITLATELIDHRNAVQHILQSSGKKVLQLAEFVNQAHYQGILLPLFVEHGEVNTLLDVAKNIDCSEQARLGAIEGLAVIANDKAQKALEKIAKVKKQDKEICKAAWRALRRAKRRQKAS